jgi:hypothetical protein
VITQLAREGSPPPGLRLRQTKLSRNSNQIARGRIRRIAVGTLITERPPHRTVRAQFGHTVYGAFFVKGASRHFCRALLLHSLFDPRREHCSVRTAYYRRPSRTVTVKDGACSAPPKACPAPMRARRQAARDRVVGRAMIRGEPAIGREQSREPRLYSVEPTWGLDHEAVIRFCGQGSDAAGPFSQRHCSHSRIRIAATSDRHRLPGSSNAVRCRTLFVLSRSRVLLTRVSLTPSAATRHRPAPHRS